MGSKDVHKTTVQTPSPSLVFTSHKQLLQQPHTPYSPTAAASEKFRPDRLDEGDDKPHSDQYYSTFYSSIPTFVDNPVEHATSTGAGSTKPSIVSNTYFYGQSPSNALANDFSASLGTRTPIQIVAMSNLKLNSDIFSSRSVSIHRRILVKNLLTLIYEMNPKLDWFEDGGGSGLSANGGCSTGLLLGDEEQSGWMEQTLNAAGLKDDDDDEESITSQGKSNAVDRRMSSPVDDDDFEPIEDDLGVDKNGAFFPGSEKNERTIASAPTSSTLLDPLSPAAFASPRPPPATPVPSPAPSSSSSSSPSSSISSAYTLSETPSSGGSKYPSNSSSPPSRYSRIPTSFVSTSFGSSTPSPGFLSPPTKLSLPRPKSTELPQSLNNYLAAVFDVDWSVALSSTEDSLFTFGGSSSSPLPSSDSCLASGTFSPSSTSCLIGSLLSSSPKRKSLISPSSALSTSRLAPPAMTSSPGILTDGLKPYGANESTPETPYGDGPVFPEKDVAPLCGPGIANNTNIPGEKTEAENIRNINRKQSLTNASSVSKSNDSVGMNGAFLKKSSSMRKTTLVPGRRSSLMQTGQMPAPSKNSRSVSNSGVTIRSASNITRSERSPPLVAITTADPTVPTVSTAAGANQENISTATPPISRRSSSLPPVNQQQQLETDVSRSISTASSSGLPRPLTTLVTSIATTVTMTWASPILTPIPFSGTTASDQSLEGPNYTLLTSNTAGVTGPKAVLMSIKARRQMTSELDPPSKSKLPAQQTACRLLSSQQQQALDNTNTPSGIPSSRSQIVPLGLRAQFPPPQQLTIGTVVSTHSSSSSPVSPIHAPLSPPRSPSRLSESILSTSPTSGRPHVLPSLFPIPNSQEPPPSTSFSPSPPSSPQFFQSSQKHTRQQQIDQKHDQDSARPFVCVRSSSDDHIQILSRSSGSTSEPSSLSPSLSFDPPFPLSPPSSPSFPAAATLDTSDSKKQRPAGVYSFKASSKSSPNLSLVSLDTLNESEMSVGPSPSLPALYQDQVHHPSKIHRQQPQSQPPQPPRHQQRLMALGPSPVISMRTSSKQMGRKSDDDLDGSYEQTDDSSNSRATTATRWTSMKMILGLKN
ncbi:hypothetical protein BGX28_001550 [Mortierella sp. GBA30]|nr:hypothetical protein BGX28_001550 [Mortierella sp. GBA30]